MADKPPPKADDDKMPATEPARPTETRFNRGLRLLLERFELMRTPEAHAAFAKGAKRIAETIAWWQTPVDIATGKPVAAEPEPPPAAKPKGKGGRPPKSREEVV